MSSKEEKLKKLSASLRTRWEETWVCEKGIEHHVIHSPHYPDPIHIEIINHPDQLQ